eukprot:4466594-Alexandrium_andersonii.AAC.1
MGSSSLRSCSSSPSSLRPLSSGLRSVAALRALLVFFKCSLPAGRPLGPPSSQRATCWTFLLVFLYAEGVKVGEDVRMCVCPAPWEGSHGHAGVSMSSCLEAGRAKTFSLSSSSGNFVKFSDELNDI